MDRFKNWVRWCNTKGFHRGQAGSAEGEYRSGQIWDPEDARGEEIDVLDAELVNRAFCQLGERLRRVIQVLYFRVGWSPKYQAHRLGVKLIDLPKVGLEARMTLLARVEFLERRVYSSPTAPRRSLSLSGTTFF